MTYLIPAHLTADKHPDLRAFVESAGYILGAASCCSDIDRPRILVATDRIKELVRVSAVEKSDALTYGTAFAEGITAGTKALDSGELDRAQADTALAALERIIGR
jgi:hypothetical protein